MRDQHAIGGMKLKAGWIITGWLPADDKGFFGGFIKKGTSFCLSLPYVIRV